MTSEDDDLLATLAAAAGADAVRTDAEAIGLAANDAHESGLLPLAVIRPQSAAKLAACVAAATSAKCAVAPRGGGLSYTAGYVPRVERTVTIDTRGLNRIHDVSAEDMTVTVGAGVTWKQLYHALQPLGLRLPFFGTFSGKGATVGGGLSHGALFFGSARYGSAAEIVLGLQVALADGRLLETGQGALKADSKRFFRNFGPDLTGVFVHDGGTLGVKTRATLRLITAPKAEGFFSAAFDRFDAACAALSEIARRDLAEEVYVLDPMSTDQLAIDAADMLRSATAVAKTAKGGANALKALAQTAKAGTHAVPEGMYSLHLTAAGRSDGAVSADIAQARKVAIDAGGQEIVATIPRVSRADLFANLNSIIGPGGGRWAALNAKVAHSDAGRLIAAFEALIRPYAAQMEASGVHVTQLASALSNHCFSFEPVFHWRDSWQPIHRVAADDKVLRRHGEPPPNPEGRSLVDTLRRETVTLFQRLGAASNQIGRTYPYYTALNDDSAALVAALKRYLDPNGLMNPGVLELPTTGGVHLASAQRE